MRVINYIIFLLVLVLLIVCPSAYAGNLNFLYTHGSDQVRNNFTRDVNQLHVELAKQIANNKEMQKYFLQNNTMVINKHADIFYWQDESLKEKHELEASLKYIDELSPIIATKIRDKAQRALFDLFWVKSTNKLIPVFDGINKKINKQNKDDQTVLFGYSTGSEVYLQYLINTLPYVNTKDLGLSTDIPNTCFSAMYHANIIDFNQNDEIIVKTNSINPQQLTKYTAQYCSNPKRIKGFVSIGSQYATIYPNLYIEGTQQNTFFKKTIRYMLANNIFIINLTYSKDPLSVPIQYKIKYDKNNDAFFHDKSDIYAGRNFILAHFSYIEGSKSKFAKSFIQTYLEGFKK